MEFNFSKEEKSIKKAISNFVKNEIIGKELDKKDHIPKNIIELMANLDLFSLKVSDEYGGLPASYVEMGIVAEELAMGSTGISYFAVLSWTVSQILAKYGTKAVKDKWLPVVSKGRKLGCVSVTELDRETNFMTMKTKSRKEGKVYVINGEKTPVSFGSQSDFAILFAINENKKNSCGSSVFFVPLEQNGIKKTTILTMGLMGANLTQITIENVKVSDIYKIGEEGQGEEINKRHGLQSDFYRVLSGLIPIGIARRALNMAIRHVKTRKAFGRPIAQFQAISEKIAEAATTIEMGRWLCYRALWLKDHGHPNAKESFMCSWWCPKSAYKVIEDALLLHGHLGYSNEYPFEQMLRDVIAFEMIGGTEETMKTIIAQNVIGKDAVPEFLKEKINI